MQNARELKIGAAEVKRLSIKNVNNRPNAMATYGQAKMSSTEAKNLFDRQFELIVSKYNELCDMLAGLDSEYATDEALRLGVDGAKGISGRITLTEWTGDENGIVSTKDIEDVGPSDAIFFAPASVKDRALMIKYDVYVSPQPVNTRVTFFAETLPVESISLLYFIARGAA